MPSRTWTSCYTNLNCATFLLMVKSSHWMPREWIFFSWTKGKRQRGLTCCRGGKLSHGIPPTHHRTDCFYWLPSQATRKAENWRFLVSVAGLDKIEGALTRVKWANPLGPPHCLGSTFMKKWRKKLYSFPAVVLDYLYSLSGSWLFIERDRADNCIVLGENLMIQCLHNCLTQYLAHIWQFLNIAARFNNIPICQNS